MASLSFWSACDNRYSDRIQAKSKRLGVLINGAALSATHGRFPLVFSSVDNNLGWGAQCASQAWVLILPLWLTSGVPGISLSFLLCKMEMALPPVLIKGGVIHTVHYGSR